MIVWIDVFDVFQWTRFANFWYFSEFNRLCQLWRTNFCLLIESFPEILNLWYFPDMFQDRIKGNIWFNLIDRLKLNCVLSHLMLNLVVSFTLSHSFSSFSDPLPLFSYHFVNFTCIIFINLTSKVLVISDFRIVHLWLFFIYPITNFKVLFFPIVERYHNFS